MRKHVTVRMFSRHTDPVHRQTCGTARLSVAIEDYTCLVALVCDATYGPGATAVMMVSGRMFSRFTEGDVTHRPRRSA